MPPRSEGPDVRFIASVGVLSGLVPLLLAAEPGLLSGARLLGSGTADLWGHTWATWWAADALSQGLPPWAPGPLDHPRGQHWTVIDLPLPLLLLPVSALLGPVAALLGHSLLRSALVGAGLAAWLRHQGLGRGGTAVVVLAALSSTYVRGLYISGVSEGLSLLLAPVFAWLLRRWLVREGGLAPPLLLGLFCVLDGAWAAVAAALLGGLSTLAELFRGPRRARLLARAGAVALPSALAFGMLLRAQAARAHQGLVAAAPLPELAGQASSRWAAAPMGGIDLLGLVAWQRWLPAPPPDLDHRHLAYLGAPLLLAAGLAAWKAPRVRGLVATAALLLLLALGDRMRLAGLPVVNLPLPGGLLTARGGQNVYRFAGLASVLLLAAAALGLRGRLARIALVVLLLDQLAAAPLRLPTVPNPAGAVETWLAEGEGAVLDLPLEDDRPESSLPGQHRSLFLQANHGRPIASALLREAQVLKAGVAPVVQLQEFALAVSASTDTRIPLKPLDRAVGEAAIEELLGLGFTAVSLDLDRLPKARRTRVATWMTRWLGPPAVEGRERMGWELAAEP